jgi:hypothetical protein
MPDGTVRQQNGASASDQKDEQLPKPPEMSTEEHELESEGEPSFFTDPAQITKTLLIVAVLIAAIYIAVPKLAGLDDAIELLGGPSAAGSSSPSSPTSSPSARMWRSSGG